MAEPVEALAAPAEAGTADQETLARGLHEDELQDIIDEKVADTLLNSDMEVDTSETDAPE